MKEINYFDTPDDRRKGNHFMADFMAKVYEDRAKRREILTRIIPRRYTNLQELKENYDKR